MPRAKSATIAKSKETLNVSLVDELLFREAAILSAACERKLLAEDAPRGKIQTKYGLEIVPGVRRKKKGLVATLALSMSGKDATETTDTNGEEAFNTSIKLEGFFELLDQEKALKTDDVCPNTIKAILSQLVPVATLKVRDLAAGMGYINVRTTLGFNIKDFDVNKIEAYDATKPPKATKPSRRSKKAVAIE